MREPAMVVIGASAGGLRALRNVLTQLASDFPAPVVVAQHMHASSKGYFVEILQQSCKLTVMEAEDKEQAMAGHVYVAPPNYHLLVEYDMSLALSVDERENYARPSIDVLFETASDAMGTSLAGVLLTGANQDGSNGMVCLKQRGGYAIIEDPTTAEVDVMPRSAIEAVERAGYCIDQVVPHDAIGSCLVAWAERIYEGQQQYSERQKGSF